MAILPKVKLKAVPVFPANVFNGPGIDVEKQSGNYTITLNVSNFQIGNVSPALAPIVYAVSWGNVTTDNPSGEFSLVPFAGLQSSSSDLSSLAGLASYGLVARVGDADYVTTTLTGTANEVTVTDGDAIDGAPTISLPAALTFTGKTVTGGTFSNPTINTPTGIVKGDVGLGNVDNTSDATKNTAVATLTGKTIDGGANTITGLTTTVFAANVVDTDATLSANSDTRIPTQKAVKSYADSLIAAQDAMVYKGVIDCSANPDYPAADRGHTYRVSVAGKIGGASGITVEVGDILLCLTDGTASGDQATVGSKWSIIQANIDGAVVGPASVTDDVPAVFDGTTGKLIKAKTYAAFKTLLALVKGDVGLGNVANVDTTNASNISSGTLAVARGGVDQGSWSTWTPTFTMSTVGGTPITAAVSGNGARYKQVGKTVFWSLDVTISNVGSGNSGIFIFSSPITAVNSSVVYGGNGKEAVTSGKMLAIGNWDGTSQTIAFADNSAILAGGNGTRFQVSGFYEAA